MKRRRAFSVALIVLSVPILVFSQVSVSGDTTAGEFFEPVYGLGFSAGPASGIGVSFRTHFASKSSIQLIGGVIKSGDVLSLSFGGEFQYDLVRGKSTRFFFGPAVSYFYKGSDRNEMKAPIRTALGLGGEFSVLDALHVTVEGTFVFFSDGDVVPLGQIAVHYYFY